MKKPKYYNITPAKGQALLNFQGRRFPDKIEVFETETIEEVSGKKQNNLFADETVLNSDFKNILLYGDCLSACAYLKSNNIKIDLVYIDPPFASGANYAKKVYLRNNGKESVNADDNTIGEEIMYGDIWQKEDYLNWIYERLLAIKDVMSDTASIYVHLDWHIGHYVKILLDEIFGEECFRNEIVWCYSGPSPVNGNYSRKHDIIFFYSKNEKIVFNQPYITHKSGLHNTGQVFGNLKSENPLMIEEKESKGKKLEDWWIDIYAGERYRSELLNYSTQKPEALIERIIKVSSNEGMIVADFFSGSGTTAKVANDLNRKFIACDIGINAIQTTRDRLVKSNASFDIIKIKDGLRLFRNPAQTTAKLFSIIDGFKTRFDLNLNSFWDGGLAQSNGTFTPVKFSGIHDKLTKELLDVYLEEIYKLEDTTGKVNAVIIIYCHKDIDIDQKYLNKLINNIGKTDLKINLVSLDSLLGEKKDAIFTPDNADIQISKVEKSYKVEIKQFFSPYLKNKIDEFNLKKTKSGTVEQDLSKTVKISNNGLELIESVQFDTTLDKVWKSNIGLEDKAGIKDKIKGVYTLNTDKFKIKIRNIAGDEIIITFY